MPRKFTVTLDDLSEVMVERPMIDAVHSEKAEFYLGFIPSAASSPSQKETVVVRRKSANGRSVTESLRRIEKLTGGTSRLVGLVHGRGAHYTLQMGGDKFVSLDSRLIPAGAVIPILGELRQLAKMAERMFAPPKAWRREGGHRGLVFRADELGLIGAGGGPLVRRRARSA